MEQEKKNRIKRISLLITAVACAVAAFLQTGPVDLGDGFVLLEPGWPQAAKHLGETPDGNPTYAARCQGVLLLGNQVKIRRVLPEMREGLLDIPCHGGKVSYEGFLRIYEHVNTLHCAFVRDMDSVAPTEVTKPAEIYTILWHAAENAKADQSMRRFLFGLGAVVAAFAARKKKGPANRAGPVGSM